MQNSQSVYDAVNSCWWTMGATPCPLEIDQIKVDADRVWCGSRSTLYHVDSFSDRRKSIVAK